MQSHELMPCACPGCGRRQMYSTLSLGKKGRCRGCSMVYELLAVPALEATEPSADPERKLTIYGCVAAGILVCIALVAVAASGGSPPTPQGSTVASPAPAPNPLADSSKPAPTASYEPAPARSPASTSWGEGITNEPAGGVGLCPVCGVTDGWVHIHNGIRYE